ncbi:MAG: GNAT family N-acetyltransferase [Sphingomicrobium sp.]
MHIRAETAGDAAAISAVVEAAFAGAEHSDGTEVAIVEQLRKAAALTISLVATDGTEIVGHVALSPITIDGVDIGWLGVGPVSVLPGRQNQGIGQALMHEALDRARSMGAAGCVVLGEPAYYGGFGFKADERLSFPGPPPEYFQALAFDGAIPSGTVAYHKAFGG